MAPSTNTIRVERRLQISLFILRLTISWFLMQWAVEKFVKPDVTSKIFAFFYKVPLDVNLSPVIGGVQMIIVIAFLVGFMKPLSYGVVALMHSVSTAATWKSLIMPFAEGSNHLFTTAVPVLAACWILFALRDQDVMLSVDSWRAGRRGTNSLSGA